MYFPDDIDVGRPLLTIKELSAHLYNPHKELIGFDFETMSPAYMINAVHMIRSIISHYCFIVDNVFDPEMEEWMIEMRQMHAGFMRNFYLRAMDNIQECGMMNQVLLVSRQVTDIILDEVIVSSPLFDAERQSWESYLQLKIRSYYRLTAVLAKLMNSFVSPIILSFVISLMDNMLILARPMLEYLNCNMYYEGRPNMRLMFRMGMTEVQVVATRLELLKHLHNDINY